MSDKASSAGEKVFSKVVGGLESLVSAAGERAMSILTEKVGQITDKLTDYAGDSGGPGGAALAKGVEKLKAGESPAGAAVGAGVAGGKEQVKQAFGQGGGDGGNGGGDDNQAKTDLKVTNIIESIDVGVPVWLAYNQWTQFKDFPSYMKKVENVEQESDEKMLWQAQILWSHRKWEATIIEQVPDERIVWQSKGDKGSVDGTVTFHELTPDLTRIMVVLQYHPKGFVEKTGNIWRAPGRRVRLELKHFVRLVMSQTVLHPDDVKGWRGEIRDGQVVHDPESAKPGEGKDSGAEAQDSGAKAKDSGGEAKDREAQDSEAKDGGGKPGADTGNGGRQQPTADSGDGGDPKAAKGNAERQDKPANAKSSS